jgi:NTE family protein
VEGTRPYFFEGLSANELAGVLAPLERRQFPAGAIVVAEGDSPREMYVAESGAADVYVADRGGEQHLVGHVATGGTVGEMSLFTGQPAAATVRASTDLDVVVLGAEDFELLAETFPRVYRNMGAILSERLARTNRLALREKPGRLVALEAAGAPPLLGFALASSVAWHTRASTLLIVLDDDPPGELAALADARAPQAGPSSVAAGGADLLVVPTTGEYGDERIREAIAPFFRRYEHVLVQHARPEPLPLRTAQRVPFGGNGVPALAAAEEAALADGRLPADGPAGRALGRLARELTGLRVGLALGAGSIRGYAHIGVLDALERAGVPIDYLAGSSVGAVVAGLRALGNGPQEIGDQLDELSETMFRPTLPRHALMSPRAMRKLVHARIGGHRIEDLDIPLRVVAADIVSQEEVVLTSGDLATALLAATSIPGVYPAMHVGGHTLVDGGVLNPVPTNIAAQAGANAVVGVKLLTGATRVVEGVAVPGDGPLPSVLAVILRSIDLMQTRIAVDTATVPTVTIAPDFADLPGAKLRNFAIGRRYVETGAEAAEASLPRLAAVLPWLRA